MNSGNQEAFRLDIESLRTLAKVLDIHVGIDVRKLVMAGSEQLTFRTGAARWYEFVAMVTNRLNDFIGEDAKSAVLSQAGFAALPASKS